MYSWVGPEGQLLKTDCPYKPTFWEKNCPCRPTFGWFDLIDKRPSGPTQLYQENVEFSNNIQTQFNSEYEIVKRTNTKQALNNYLCL